MISVLDASESSVWFVSKSDQSDIMSSCVFSFLLDALPFRSDVISNVWNCCVRWKFNWKPNSSCSSVRFIVHSRISSLDEFSSLSGSITNDGPWRSATAFGAKWKCPLYQITSFYGKNGTFRYSKTLRWMKSWNTVFREVSNPSRLIASGESQRLTHS